MNMRGVRILAIGLIGLALVTTRVAHADQARDWPLEVVPWGTTAYLDYLGSGAAVTLEHRKPIYGGQNALTVNASGLFGQYFGQASATAALRILLLEFSGTVGYRALWRNLQYEPGDNGAYCKDCDRPARRISDPIFDPTYHHAEYPFLEASASLLLPLNDMMVFASQFTAHWDNSPDRSFDQVYADLHDGGLMLISETTMFLKHRSWGAIGPYLQIASLPRQNRHELQAAAGLNALTRLGLITRNDVLVASVLVRPGDGSYGLHWYYMPARIILAYRMQFSL